MAELGTLRIGQYAELPIITNIRQALACGQALDPHDLSRCCSVQVQEKVKSAGWSVSGETITLPKNESNSPPVVVKRTQVCGTTRHELVMQVARVSVQACLHQTPPVRSHVHC